MRDGDRVRIDADQCRVDWLVDDEEQARRRADWQQHKQRQRKLICGAIPSAGWLSQYVRLVQSASHGCSLDPIEGEEDGGQ